MPTLTIDNRTVEVAAGTKVITAAEKMGIMIPRFCYHPALGSVGACRVCAVKFIEGPVKGIQMSCMVAASDGMKISTTDPEAVDFRRHVIEWLMLNHPHDCPVCDEGGHCLLQDMTVSSGHGRRRYLDRKRTHFDQYLGPLIAHEMNRCIQCYRCVRLYREYCGYQDLGVMGSAARVYFGRQKEGPLESPFAGNLIDICPTGVFTDRPSRHKGRRWDFERTPSICTHCALGCNLTVSARYREIVRREARLNPAINGYFICDRGRYGYAAANLKNRPRQGRIHAAPKTPSDVLSHLYDALDQLVKEEGPDTVAILGSGRSSLESLVAIKELCRAKGYLPPVFFPEKQLGANVQQAVMNFSADLAASIEKLVTSDMILVVGADPLNEAPMLALSLRQASRNNAKVVVIDPRPIELPFEFDHLATAPKTLAIRLAGLIRAGLDQNNLDQISAAARTILEIEAGDTDTRNKNDPIDAMVIEALKKSIQPVILCGTQINDALTINLAADAVFLLQKSGKDAGLLYLLPEANSFGAGLLSTDAMDVETVVEKMESGRIKALVAIECDPLMECCQRPRLEKALKKAKLLAAMDHILGPFAQKAHFFIPSATMDECGGTFINTFGLAQMAPKALMAGSPISQTGAGSHPPREFKATVAGADLVTPAKALLHLANQDNLEFRTLLANDHSAFATLADLKHMPADGIRLAFNSFVPSKSKDALLQEATSNEDQENDQLMLILVEWAIGTERISSLSPALIERAEDPVLNLNPTDALSLGLADGSNVAIITEMGKLSLPIGLNEKVAPGVLVLACHHKLEWQVLKGRRFDIDPEQIKIQIEE
jgi:NADH-quinone oxidoreductase subunit G